MLKERELSNAVLGAAIEVHRSLGPGLLERAYRDVLCHELERAGLTVAREVPVPLRYRGLEIPTAYVADLVVEGKIVIELKAIDRFHPIHRKQLLTYMTLLGLEVGYLLNFNVENLSRDGRIRMVL